MSNQQDKVRLNVNLSRATYESLKEVAHEKEESVSTVVRQAIRMVIRNLDKERSEEGE